MTLYVQIDGIVRTNNPEIFWGQRWMWTADFPGADNMCMCCPLMESRLSASTAFQVPAESSKVTSICEFLNLTIESKLTVCLILAEAYFS